VAQSYSALGIPLHKDAEVRAKWYVDEFASSLVLQAKVLASRQTDIMVLPRHINEAVDHITSDRQRRHVWREAALVVGGAVFGAAVSSFIAEASSHTPHFGFLIAYFAAAFVALLIAFFGLSG